MLNLHVKETNWLISKGICVLLFEAFNGCSLVKKQKGKKPKVKDVKHSLLRKTDSQNLSEK